MDSEREVYVSKRDVVFEGRAVFKGPVVFHEPVVFEKSVEFLQGRKHEGRELLRRAIWYVITIYGKDGRFWINDIEAGLKNTAFVSPPVVMSRVSLGRYVAGMGFRRVGGRGKKGQKWMGSGDVMSALSARYGSGVTYAVTDTDCK